MTKRNRRAAAAAPDGQGAAPRPATATGTPRDRRTRPGRAMSPVLFSPQRIGPLEIRNRVVVAPMCQYSATDGCANEWHRVHMSTMLLSSAGLVKLEATAPAPRGRITHNYLGLWGEA